MILHPDEVFSGEERRLCLPSRSNCNDCPPFPREAAYPLPRMTSKQTADKSMDTKGSQKHTVDEFSIYAGPGMT